jgi:hypothetical protein
VIQCYAERRSGGRHSHNVAAFADGLRPATLKDSTMRVYRHRLWSWPGILAVGLLLVMAGVALAVAGAPQLGGALAGGAVVAMVWGVGRRPVHRD